MKLLVFDIDGTILSNNDISTLAFRKCMLTCFGLSNYSEEWSNYNHNSDVGIIREIYRRKYNREITWHEIVNFHNCYFEQYQYLLQQNNIKLDEVPGAKNFINDIFHSGKYGVSIFTGGMPRVARRKLEILGIDRSIASSTAYDGLTRLDILNASIFKAKCRYGIEFESIVIFSDSLTDINLAKEFNIPMVGVATAIPIETFINYGIKTVITSYKNQKIEEILSDVYN